MLHHQKLMCIKENYVGNLKNRIIYEIYSKESYKSDIVIYD